MSIVDELYSEIDNGREGRNLGLKTGLPKLDWYTGGFQKGVYKLIFGQSGSGKSSYVIYSDLYRKIIQIEILYMYILVWKWVRKFYLLNCLIYIYMILME